MRYEPEPTIDALVAAAWERRPQDEWARYAARKGDRPRGEFRIWLNILASLAHHNAEQEAGEE